MDKKITELDAVVTPTDADLLTTVTNLSTTPANEKITWTVAKAFLKTYFDGLYADVLGTDDNYVTDAEKIVIGNTSGENTGDQDIPVSGTDFDPVGTDNSDDNAINTLYSGLEASKQDTLVNTTNIKSVNGTTLLGSGNLEVGGGGGAVDWIAKTTTYTAENGDGILADTSSSAWTLTLPATPSVGDVIGISDSNSTFDTNNLTVANNSSKIHGVAESLVVDLKDASFLLVYTGSTTGWKLDTYLQAGGNITLKLTDDLDADNHGIIKAKTIGFNSEYDNGSKTASTTISFSAAQKQKITLTENTLTLTLSTTDLKVGNYLLKIVNGGLATLTWASSSGSIYWSGGEPTLTSSGTDLVAVYFDGTNFYCQASLNFE